MDKLDFLISAIVLKRAAELRAGVDASDGPIGPFIDMAIKETSDFMPEILKKLAHATTP